MRIPRSKDDVLRRLIVSIDGPSGSGKTTTARAVARKLAFQHLDTGAMYRAVTLLALRDGHDMSDGEEMGRVAAGAEIHFEESNGGQRVLVNGTDVSEAIRTPEVTANVSQVSAHPSVRRTGGSAAGSAALGSAA